MTCAACIGDIESALRNLPGSSPRASTTPTGGSRWSGAKAPLNSRVFSNVCAAWVIAFTRSNSPAASARRKKPRNDCCAVSPSQAFAAMNISWLSAPVDRRGHGLDPRRAICSTALGVDRIAAAAFAASPFSRAPSTPCAARRLHWTFRSRSESCSPGHVGHETAQRMRRALISTARSCCSPFSCSGAI